MKTYEEAAEFYKFPVNQDLSAIKKLASEKLDRSKSLREEIAKSPETDSLIETALLLSIVQSPHAALLAILQFGVLIGIEMEKRELYEDQPVQP